ncbi:type II secretion system protein N [Yersinia enterocolitica]|uniref:type II secretion system protein N n=1 Tax=Yersinia enterocolitica TaxID=630 RepID=UPI001588226B|nr:type II secretion system protein N [Yersinia enterocolitica]MBW5835788.1 general secretion pathway protein GspC [Yersinia enterocolitica]MBX9474420.1 general secretion pathway protein GspC [Yersinia enterocolitica]MBX9489401.1 general secretion pathway protein GspC [Yersinia enterocolitica]MBX9491163.1 general secretion pathway protein GspC [Yersinia enterocolitica]
MEIAIILCIFYQIHAGFNRVMGKDKQTVPVLYEGESAGTNDFNKKVEMIAEIKKYYFFKQKKSDNKSKNETKDGTDLYNYPIYIGALKLVGVLEHTKEEKSIAIIENSGKQNLYFVGDEIESDTGIIIVKILSDKIIINENKSYHSLNIL